MLKVMQNGTVNMKHLDMYGKTIPNQWLRDNVFATIAMQLLDIQYPINQILY